MARLLLASRGIPDLAARLGARGPRAILIPDAADPLHDPRIPAEVQHELGRAGLDVDRVSLATSDAEQIHAAVTTADVIAVSGGDPFHLLAVARRVALGDAVRTALDAGAAYIGYSAGAMLAAPTLEPLLITRPRSATGSRSSPWPTATCSCTTTAARRSCAPDWPPVPVRGQCSSASVNAPTMCWSSSAVRASSCA